MATLNQKKVHPWLPSMAKSFLSFSLSYYRYQYHFDSVSQLQGTLPLR